ncbi:hypothetical protein Cgig2_025337 [Carnegiea gigantea]|uniref:Uncharacterized protein n=1 Tax=Carnegiea gigantea TaxID=171969 RepID=A0A9Q1JRY4_9CARY|nr:hypothetical protein Cgig2_025337 [Carnegiea gigantea]
MWCTGLKDLVIQHNLLVSEIVLRTRRKHVHSTGSEETSGQTGEESDPECRSGDEGGCQDNGSESSASKEVSSSSSDHMKRELRLKKRHDVRSEGQREMGRRKRYGVKAKGKVGEVKGRRFPATGKRIAFERSNGGSEVEQVLKGAMEERVCRERHRRRIAQKDVHIYRNYVSVLLELCRVNNTVERVAMFKKLYTFLVVSRLLFPWGAGGAAWDLMHVVEDMDGVGEYNKAEAV